MAFMTAAFATVVGAFVAVRMVDLGPDEGVLAGIMTAGYIGGSANTAAVADAMGKLNDPIMALIVATAFTVGIPFLAFLLVMPGIRWLWQLFSPVVEADVSMPEKEMVAERQQITAFSLIGALALSLYLCIEYRAGRDLCHTSAEVRIDYPAQCRFCHAYAQTGRAVARPLRAGEDLDLLFLCRDRCDA